MLCECEQRERDRLELEECDRQIEICNRNIRVINLEIVHFKTMVSYFSKNDDGRNNLSIMNNIVEILDDYTREIGENRECIRLNELRKQALSKPRIGDVWQDRGIRLNELRKHNGSKNLLRGFS
jgi:hypothetical protein